ncbi:hypothetical protein BGZ63DRAFT_365546 [Mariannaea sp. PMI_226]|nr:hypothetical protein BGZ63DRAFT_365546 [Mariannaea sp. PMI_226]
MADKITFFDVASRQNVTWSPNTWKTRLALHFKGVDYKVERYEYPEIKGRLENHVPPHDGPGPAYTFPAIQLPDGTYIMDSTAIAKYLEEKHPVPSLHLDCDYITRLIALFPPVRDASFAFFLARVPDALLNEGSLDFWYTTRREWVGMDVKQYAAENGGEAGWKAMAPALAPITALAKENEGPYFLGKEPGQADFIWASFLLFFKSMGYLDEFLAASGDAQVHLNLLEAIKPLTERNGL